MDRTAWIAIILAGIGLVASLIWEQHQAAEARAKFLQQQALLAAQATPAPSASASQTPGPANSPTGTTQPTLAQQQQPPQHEEQPEQNETLQSDLAILNFSNNKGGLATVSLLKHSGEQGKPVLLNTDLSPAIGALAQNPSGWHDSGYALSTDAAAGTATLKKTDSNGIEITKVYTLAKQAGLKDGYQIRLSISFKNTGAAAFDTTGIFVSTGAIEPIHRTDRIFATQFDWYRDSKFNSIAVNYFDPGKLFGLFQTGTAKDSYLAAADNILWAGVSNQYFATIVSPQETTGQQVWAVPFNVPSPDGQIPIKGFRARLRFPGSACNQARCGV